MKKLLAITISLIIILPQLIGVANAQTAEKSFCADVQTSRDGFFVVLEEPLGGPDAKYCYRVCNKVGTTGGRTKERVCDFRDTCKGGGTLNKDGDVTCQRVQIIKADGGLDLLNKYIRMIYLWSAGTIGIISVLILVVSGIQIMVSGASGDITEAKGRITKSLAGLVLLFLSGLILYTINPTFFV